MRKAVRIGVTTPVSVARSFCSARCPIVRILMKAPTLTEEVSHVTNVPSQSANPVSSLPTRVNHQLQSKTFVHSHTEKDDPLERVPGSTKEFRFSVPMLTVSCAPSGSASCRSASEICPLQRRTLVPVSCMLVSMDNDKDNDTERSPSNNCQWPGLTGMSERVMTPRKRVC